MEQNKENIWWCELCARLSDRAKETKYTNTKLGIVEPDSGIVHTATDSGASMQLRISKDEHGNIKAAQMVITQRCRKCKSEQQCIIQATAHKVIRL